MRNYLGLVLPLLLAACSSGGGLSPGSDGSTTGNDLAASGNKDMAANVTQDFAMSSGDAATHSDAGGVAGAVSCGTMSCTSGNSCCVTPNNGSPTYACMAMCPMGTIAASCDGPEDCSSGACCANITFANNMPGGAAACESPTNDCSTGSASFTSIKTKLCHSPSDCAGYMGSNPFGGGNEAYDNCCSYTNVSYMFCAPAMASDISGVTCAM